MYTRLESNLAMSFRTYEIGDLQALERRTYYWTGWRRRHWPADVLRPGVTFYGFDTRRRVLFALLKATRGGSFTYTTKREFGHKVEILTEWRPNTSEPHWKKIPIAAGGKVNTGLALRYRLLKTLHIPLHGCFPQLGWLNLAPTGLANKDIDPAEEFIEGGRQIQTHMRIERQPLLRARAKDLWRQRLGQLRCLVCGFEYSPAYGDLGADFIEMHHGVPLSSLGRRWRVSPHDLKPLCANCHRMIHRQKPFPAIRELWTIVAERRPTRALQRTRLRWLD